MELLPTVDRCRWRRSTSSALMWSAHHVTNHPPSVSEMAQLEELTPEECYLLFASQVVGRIAVSGLGGAPLVVPVNFALDEGAVVFCTGYGTKLRVVSA